MQQPNEIEVTTPTYPHSKLTIIGGGIIGFLEAYYAYLAASERGERIRITLYEKNNSIADTTTAHLVPSLTPDEILAVVPRSQELMNQFNISLTEPGGIRVDDVTSIHDAHSTNEFMHAVATDALNDAAHRTRREKLLALGKISMALWQNMYDHADADLKGILDASHFKPCKERTNPQVHTLDDGYRIDLIYGVGNAIEKAYAMKSDYEFLGYRDCRILSPDEAKALDPFLKDFCQAQSEETTEGLRVWKSGTIALWRPGGCIDTQTFLPLFCDYLKNVMGKYINQAGAIKDCFQFKLQRRVEGVSYESTGVETLTRRINGLKFFDHPTVKHNKHPYPEAQYVFCPGEAVGTLRSLGFAEPEYARFAGASLILRIPIPTEKIPFYEAFNHWMEIHHNDVAVAWQARCIDHHLFIGIGGTKAFYGDQTPNKNQEFAIKKNLIQLNIINDILPEFLSWALEKPTHGRPLTLSDMLTLETKGIADRWVGSRAVAYDGFPTVGHVFNEHAQVDNARCTTHLGSGGVSFAHAVVCVSRGRLFADASQQTLAQEVLVLGNSLRTHR